MSSRGVLRSRSGRRAAIVGSLLIAAVIAMWLFLAVSGATDRNCDEQKDCTAEGDTGVTTVLRPVLPSVP